MRTRVSQARGTLTMTEGMGDSSRASWRTRLGVATALVGALLLNGVLSAWLANRATLGSVLEDLAVAPADSGVPTLFYLFRPGDCKTSAFKFDSLTALDTGRVAHVVGVMVQAPPREAEAIALGRAFGARFTLRFDRTGRAEEALRSAGLALPVLILWQAGRIEAVQVRAQAAPGRGLVDSLVASDGRVGVALSSAPRADSRRLLSALPGVSLAVLPYKGAELLDAGRGLVVVLDRGARTIVVFDREGRQRRVLVGPGGDATVRAERITDLKVLARGIGILHGEPREFVRLPDDGGPVERFAVDGSPQRFAELGGGDLALFDDPRRPEIVSFYGAKGLRRETRFMPNDLAHLAVLLRESRVLRLPESDTLLVAHVWSTRLDVVELASWQWLRVPTPEQRPWPELLSWTEGGGVTVKRVAPRAEEATLAIGADRNRVYVLARRLDGQPVLDLYQRRTLRYEASLAVPTTASLLTVDEQGPILVTQAGDARTSPLRPVTRPSSINGRN